MSLALLQTYRSQSIRASDEVLENGRVILETRSLKSLGDDAWPILEQVCIAALDLGDLVLADECLTQLDARFPGSPRVECLQGMRLEASGELENARILYEHILEEEDSNAAAWKRLIAVYKQLGQIPKAIDQLVIFLDTFYQDLEGWLELAALYASLNLYEKSLQSLSHALLIAPQNPFYALQFAETAYTANDVPLALATFLRVTELVDGEVVKKGGVAHRAWFGVKQCVRRLQNPSSRALPSASHTAPPKHLGLLDELATERLLATYSGKGVKGRDGVIKWLEGR